MQTCDASVKNKFIGDAFHTQKSIFQKIEDKGIFVPKEGRFIVLEQRLITNVIFLKKPTT